MAIATRVEHYPVKLHTCSPLQERGQILEYEMLPNEFYICIRNPRKESLEKPYLEEIEKEPEYYMMPRKCTCRAWLKLSMADEMIDSGLAVWVYKTKNHAVVKCEPGLPHGNSIGHIWCPGIRGRVPRIDLITKADIERGTWLKFEKPTALQKEYAEYMWRVNDITMTERAKWIVPFRPDPTEGRILFPFSPDERTHR